MNRELTHDFLQKAGMDAAQAEALSGILSDMEARLATKADLASLKAEMRADLSSMKAEMRADLSSLKAEMRADLSSMKAGISADLASLNAAIQIELASHKGTLLADSASLKAELTWRFIALTGFLAVLITLLNMFVS